MPSASSRVRRGRRPLLLVTLGVVLTHAPAAFAVPITQPAAVDVSATAGVPFSGPVATFKSTNGVVTAFTATVTWGEIDAPPTAATIDDLGQDPGDPMLTVYRVSAGHQYPNPGTFVTTVKIDTESEPTETVVGTATVHAPIHQPAAAPVTATAATPFDGRVATFSSNLSDPAMFSATVGWGDATPAAPGTIVPLGADAVDPTLYRYRVDAQHTYAAAGTYATDVALRYLAEPPVGVSGSATVAAAPDAPNPPPPSTPAAPTPAPPTPPRAPTIVETTVSPAPQVGRRSVYRLTASAPDAPVSGYTIDFGEPGARFGLSACTLLATPSAAFTPGPARTWELGHTFRRAGRHRIQLVVRSGVCGREAATSTSTLVVTVRKRPVRRTARVTTARSSEARGIAAQDATRGCPDELLEPDGTNVAAVTTAAVCLINRERAAARLPGVKVDARLVQAAKAHNTAMVEGRFFSHQGPSEPGLAERGRAAKYPGGMAENIGYGAASSSTARSIVEAWMKSPPHRENILGRDYSGIAVDVIDSAPTGSAKPGASYTANFGTEPAQAPSTTDPATTVTRPRTTTLLPAIAATLAPRTFAPAASGPPAPATGALPASVGTVVDFLLPSAAKVVVTVRRRRAGRRLGRRCVAPGRSTRPRRRCTRLVRVGRFTVPGVEGANAVRFSGRLAGRRLPAGTYVLEVVATDANGRRTRPRATPFQVTR